MMHMDYKSVTLLLQASSSSPIIGNSFALSEGNQLLEKVTDFRMNHFNPFLMYN